MNEMSVVTMLNGAIVERVNDALREAVTNTQDMNTEAKAVRKVILEISIKPNAERDLGNVGISVKTKLASPKEIGTILFMGMDGKGNVYAYENNPRQSDLFQQDKQQPAEKISNLLEVSR